MPFRFSYLLVAGVMAVLGACSTNIDHHGYLAKPGAFSQLREGMPKSEVVGVLGSPSTTASINMQGDSYYYISSTTKQTAFLKPSEVDRQVIAVRFDANDQVQTFAQYGMDDGQIIDINSRETPTRGREFSLIQQMLGNVGKPGPGGAILPGKTSGSPGTGTGTGMPGQ
jgi:outer membrane protein assembly factor BamE (lipoprotein component of BamABCDE complex)